jgi:plasmid stabilization system protein ParE
MPQAIYLPEARDDVDAAYTYYEGCLAGLGDRFLTALAHRVGVIEGNPRLYGEVRPRVRAAALRRFPYVVYYREQAGRVLIIAVRHGRDDPAIWQARV